MDSLGGPRTSNRNSRTGTRFQNRQILTAVVPRTAEERYLPGRTEKIPRPEIYQDLKVTVLKS